MAAALREVGYFSELRHGRSDGPSLRASLHPEGSQEEVHLVRYLRSASVLAANGPVSDVLSGDPLPDALSVMTDGTWMWPSDLAFYVERYHAELPTDFVDHARQSNWNPRQLSDEELIALARSLFASPEASE
jgi:hypothetical protein